MVGCSRGVAVFFACGWIVPRPRWKGRPDDSRLLAGALAVVMVPASSPRTFAAIAVPLVRGVIRGPSRRSERQGGRHEFGEEGFGGARGRSAC